MRTTSSKPLWVLLPLVVLCCLVAVAASSVTKEEIVRMAREGRSDQVIIDAIHNSDTSFDLTANDIADLRQSGVSQLVIDAMIESSPVQPDNQVHPEPQNAPESPVQAQAPGHVPLQQDVGDDYQDDEDVQQEPAEEPPPYDAYYPAPLPVFYPVYPIYSPFYYPVYDPYFSFFGGFAFSFAFVDPFGFHEVFPCDRSFVVIHHSGGFHPGGFHPGTTFPVRDHPVTFTTRRNVPVGSTPLVSRAAQTRGNTTFPQPNGQRLAPRPNSFSNSDPARPGRSSEVPYRSSYAAPRYGQPGQAYAPRTAVPRRSPAPRPFMDSPRSPMPPRMPAMPGYHPAPRSSAPRFGGGPSFRGPSGPRSMPMPRGGYSSGGGMRGSGGGGSRGGGGHGRGGHH